jgi:DNA-binding NarL/FixJ family response regulator
MLTCGAPFISLPEVTVRSRRAGARGYVVKNKAETDFVPAVEAVLSGIKFVSSLQALDNVT